MEYNSYSEKLKDPRWQKKRLEILERDNWTCRFCGCKDKSLHVHHLFYLPKREPWEYPRGFLIALCEDCHTGLNEYDENIVDIITERMDVFFSFFWESGRSTHDLVALGCVIDKLKLGIEDGIASN